MYDVQLISSLIVIGILSYSCLTHGLVYIRMPRLRVHGVFSLLCLFIAAYAALANRRGFLEKHEVLERFEST